jgi:hypothetical protein
MRALLAAALILGGAVALPAAADARKAVRSGPAHAVHPRYHPHRYYRPRAYYYRPRGYYYAPPTPYMSEQAACEARAEADDPTGLYRGYPCWARSAFGRGSGGGGRR